jgi:hypothetical protein
MSTAVSKTAHYWTLLWSRWIQSIYYACFHSIIQYGIIFWGNSTNSVKIFTLQKKIFRIMADAQPRTSCVSLFKQLEILPVPCQYILQLCNLLSIIKNFFKQIHLNTTLIQGISFIFIDQTPAYPVFKKVHSMLAQKFSNVYHLVQQSSRMTRHNLKQP